MTKDEIWQEFGKPAEELFGELRAHSTFRTISATFEIHEMTLRRWRRQWDTPIGGEAKLDEFSCREPPIDKVARTLGFDTATDAIRFFTLKLGLNNRQMASRLRCCVNTVINHKPSEIKR